MQVLLVVEKFSRWYVHRIMDMYYSMIVSSLLRLFYPCASFCHVRIISFLRTGNQFHIKQQLTNHPRLPNQWSTLRSTTCEAWRVPSAFEMVLQTSTDSASIPMYHATICQWHGNNNPSDLGIPGTLLNPKRLEIFPNASRDLSDSPAE